MSKLAHMFYANNIYKQFNFAVFFTISFGVEKLE